MRVMRHRSGRNGQCMRHRTGSSYASPVAGYRCVHPGGPCRITGGVWRVNLTTPARLFLYGASASAVQAVHSSTGDHAIGLPNAKGARSLGLCTEGDLTITFYDHLLVRCPETSRGRYWEATQHGTFCCLDGTDTADWDSEVSYDSRTTDDLRADFVRRHSAKRRVRRNPDPIPARIVPCPTLLARGGCSQALRVREHS